MSKAVLEIVHPTKVTVEGLNWLGEKKQRIPNERLVAKILCEAHNNALSGLDESARKFFRWMQDAAVEFAENHPLATTDWIRSVNGHDIERWLLKLLFGLLASGVADTGASTRLHGRPPPPRCLNILFGYEAVPYGWGMYWRTRFGLEEVKSFALEFATTTHDNTVGGVLVSFNGHEFQFVMREGGQPQVDATESCYRPRELDFRFRGTQKVIHLGWSDDLLLSDEELPEHKHLAFELPWAPIPPIPDPD